MLNKLKEWLGDYSLGTGAADNAARKLDKRSKQLDDQEDEAMGIKPKKR